MVALYITLDYPNCMKSIPIKKSEPLLQIVYGEVYAPNIPDAQGDFMRKDAIRKIAHRFLASGKVNQIDVEHNNVLTTCRIVESFIARKDDSLFIPDAWVIGVHVPDEQLWSDIESGEINGFSIEGLTLQKDSEILVGIPDTITGKTGEKDGHSHVFTVKYDDQGNFLGGSTNVVEDHKHVISRGTATEIENGHNHTFDYVDQLTMSE